MTQREIDQAANLLFTAMENLEFVKVNKEELKLMIDKVINLDEKLYTTRSFKAFKKVLDESIEIYEDPNATQAEVDKALRDLVLAYGSLKKVDDTSTDGNGGGTTDGNGKDVPTGIQNPTMIMSVVLLGGLALLALLKKKRVNKL